MFRAIQEIYKASVDTGEEGGPTLQFLRLARFLRIMRLLRVMKTYRVFRLAKSEFERGILGSNKNKPTTVSFYVVEVSHQN